MKRPEESEDRQAILAEFLKELQVPPEGVRARVDRFQFVSIHTGETLGGLVMWSYGDVSAFLTADHFRERCYSLLPPAAQVLVDADEDLTTVAEYEAKRAQHGGGSR